jgi:hypothetical protein
MRVGRWAFAAEQFGLATVLTFLDLERRSGELLLLASGGVGRLWLHRGRVVRARIEGSCRARKAAVYELLTWNGGRFNFLRRRNEGIPQPPHMFDSTRVDELSDPPGQRQKHCRCAIRGRATRSVSR